MKRCFSGFLVMVFFFFLFVNLVCAKRQDAQVSYLKLPLTFIKNEGQTDASIRYYEQGAGHVTVFTEKGISVALNKIAKIEQNHKPAEVVTLVPITSYPFTIDGLFRMEGKFNYLLGNDPYTWKTNISTYGAVLYKDIYPGIDMKVYGTNSQLEYDIIVSPHKDPTQIRFAYTGIEQLSLTPQGELAIILRNGFLIQKKPIVYQIIDGTRKEIDGFFTLADVSTYGFTLGPFNKDYPVVIDPTLVYSTYLGGNEEDRAWGIAVDSSGNMYVTGNTFSTNFPMLDPYDGTNDNGQSDAFITKFNQSGGLVYSTYLGGRGGDNAQAIAVDTSGNVYVAGSTGSPDFPLLNFYQECQGATADAFVTKLSPSGDSLVYSTCLGGSNNDYARTLAVDSLGNTYVSGDTYSYNFPTLNAFQVAHAGGERDVFITKFDSLGGLVYSTYLGGNGDELTYGLDVDSSGNAYVAGFTNSTNFPNLNGLQVAYAGGDYDGFVTKLAPSGNSLVYSTYLGGNSTEEFRSLAVDSSGNAYVAGFTNSTNFPTANAYQPSKSGGVDAFVTKLSPSGNSLVYSTYLGGNSTDMGFALAVDSLGHAYVAGQTESSNFPILNSYQWYYAGGVGDIFITKLSPSGNSLVYSTYLGGTGQETAYALALDSSGNVHVAGKTTSSNFPILNPEQGSYAGNGDAFVSKLSPGNTLTVQKSGNGAGTITSTPEGIACGVTCTYDFSQGVEVTLTANASTGSTFTLWTGCDETIGNTCIVNMTTNKTVSATFTLNQHTLTVNKTGTGTGTVTSSPSGINCGTDCLELYDYGTIVTLTAASSTGSSLPSWTGCDSSSGSTCTVTITANESVSAAFTALSFLTSTDSVTITEGSTATFQVKLNAQPASNVTVSVTRNSGDSDITVSSGSNLTFTTSNWNTYQTVTLAAGQDDDIINGTAVIRVSASGITNKEVTATEADNDLTLTVGKSGTGAGTITGTGIACGADCTDIYNYGTEVVLTAASSAGSSFTSWIGCDNPSGNTCTVILTSNKSVTASFALNQYNLNVGKSGTGNGTVTAAGINCGPDCSEILYYGSVVALTATESIGSSFTGWNGCDAASINVCALTITGNKSVSASFTLNQHTLAATITGTGSGTLTALGLYCTGDTCTGIYNYGDTIQITANPGTGSVFGEWTGCDSIDDNVCTILINEDKNVTGSFFLEFTLAVTLDGTGDGRVTSTPSGIDCEPTCSDTFIIGTPIQLTARPYAGSVFAYWSGGCAGTTETCDLIMTNYIGVTAHFTSENTKEYTLNVKKVKKNRGDGTVTSTDGNIDCGDACSYAYYKDTVVSLSAEAYEGSTFIGWKPDKLNCTGTNPCTVNIDKAKTVQAIFVGDYALKVTTQSKKKGTGTVVSIPVGINCTTGSKEGCTALYGYGEAITLAASADAGSTFLGWTPANLCPGTGVCIVPLNKKRTVKALFLGQ